MYLHNVCRTLVFLDTSANVKSLTLANYPTDATYEVRAHGSSQNTVANRYHVIKINVYEGLTYYVEVSDDESWVELLIPIATITDVQTNFIIGTTSSTFNSSAIGHWF